MAWRLDDEVVRGELFNLRRNSVHGWIELRDHESPLRLELTGNFGDSLAGKHLRFEARDAADREASSEPPNLNGQPRDPEELEPMQVGPTGDMHLRQVQPASSDAEVPCLLLEWFSQNGRMVIELVDPILEFVENEEESNLDDEEHEQSIDISSLSLDDDEEEADDFDLTDDDDEDPDDPFGLFPDDLEEQLASTDDGESADGESPPRGRYSTEIDEETRKQWALWDEMFEGKHDVPIQTIFDPPLRLYPADKLDDAQVAQALRLVLARLAEYGIALDMCQHFTPREAYQLLLEEILPKHGTYPRLRATGFVQHYSTSDFCLRCDAEFEEKWQREKEANGNGFEEGNDSPPDDEQTY